MNRAQLLLLMATEYWKMKIILIMNSQQFPPKFISPHFSTCVYTTQLCKNYRILYSSYFRRAFIFRYFEEAFFSKNKFLGSSFPFSQALTWLNYQCIVDMFVSAPITLYWYFKLVWPCLKVSIVGRTALSYY